MSLFQHLPAHAHLAHTYLVLLQLIILGNVIYLANLLRARP